MTSLLCKLLQLSFVRSSSCFFPPVHLFGGSSNFIYLMTPFKHQSYFVRMWGISWPMSVDKELLYFNGGNIFFWVKALVYDFIKVSLIVHLVSLSLDNSSVTLLFFLTMTRVFSLGWCCQRCRLQKTRSLLLGALRVFVHLCPVCLSTWLQRRIFPTLPI